VTTWPELEISIAGLRRRDNLAELKRRASDASSIAFDTMVVAKDLAITTSRIPDGESIHVRGSAESALAGVELRGTVTSAWEGECRRCLDLVRGPVEIELHATFLESGSSTDDADAYTFDGEAIDVGEVVREELMLFLPLSPLCTDECAGADPDRFSSLVEHVSGGGEDEAPSIDPRWAALSELTFDED
jgi:uncharacterized protein